MSSLPLVYLFLSLNVCLGMLVFLEPFLNGGLLFSRKEASRTKLKDEVSPCVIEVTSSVDFQNSQIHPDEVEDDKERDETRSKVIPDCFTVSSETSDI